VCAAAGRKRKTLMQMLARMRRGGPGYACKKLGRMGWDQILRVYRGIRGEWRAKAVWALCKATFGLWERIGVHVVPAHFYSPVPVLRRLPDSVFERQSPLLGIDMNVQAQLDFLDNVCARYKPEYDRFGLHEPADGAPYYSLNGMFGAIDGDLLYCMVRHFKPKRIIEIGSGWSTLVATYALRQNKRETGEMGGLVAIEPYPGRHLRKGFEGLIQVIPQDAQQVPLDLFQTLGENDILFIDSSHVVKTGSDVCYEFLEIIPSLKPGVLVHVHDIFLPCEYPRHWLRRERLFWNEAYLLQAFLVGNRSFEVVLAGHFLKVRYPERMSRLFRTEDVQSFWMRRKA